ncbi:MAG TPA: histidine--tRNA ligase, partial [Anaerolineaceae bacterium]|nr:histidine--tRNA ligase [Anaerolineaceae bacterium]
PEDMAVRSWLYRLIGEVSSSFGYQEWDAPFLEKIELYAAKSGEELVKEQSFVFEDRGGDLITLRPELTPSLARLVAQRQKELPFPLRWWSFGPFWRYERPQKGRTREFFQWNIDMIGPNSPEADAELVAIAATFLQRAGFNSNQVALLVNNRRLMDSVLADLGIRPEQRVSVFRLIDRRDKLSPTAWEEYALEIGLTTEQLQGLRGVLADPDLWQRSPEFRRFIAAVERLGVRDFVRFEPQIIRGLDYYTGTVFEAKEIDAGGRSILGGGRYDNLVEDVGGEPVSAVGFAMGDVMIGVLLREYGLVKSEAVSPAQVLVTVFDDSRLLNSYELAANLRAAGIRAAAYPEPVKLPKQLKYADRMGIRFVVIAGPDEEEQGLVTVKDLGERTQSTSPREQLAEKLRQILA